MEQRYNRGPRQYQQAITYHVPKELPTYILKKSKKFEEAGNIKEAMNVIVAYLDELSRKNEYTSDYDRLMENFNRLCVKSKNSRVLGQGMFLYRRFCFNRNPEALERVVEDLLNKIKEGFEKAKESLKDVKLPKDSLEVDTDMDSFMCNAFSGSDTEPSYNENTNEIKFYYDSLRAVFDTLRFQIESKVYSEAVELLIQFCKNYNRPNELRTIAEQFYSHIQKASQDGIDITPVTNLRFKFAEICYETGHLELALKALAGSETSLVNTSNVLTSARCQEMLAKIYLKTHNYLLHAVSLFKHYIIIKNNKSTIEAFSDIDTKILIDSLICAVLSIPFEQDNAVNTSKAQFFNSIDSTQSIIENADPNLANLYTLICRCNIKIPSGLVRKEISKYLDNLRVEASNDSNMKLNMEIYGGLICKTAFSYVMACSSKKCGETSISSETISQMYKEIFNEECTTKEQKSYIHQTAINLITNKILPDTISIKSGKLTIEITNKKDTKKLITDEPTNSDNYTNAIERYTMRGAKKENENPKLQDSIKEIKLKMKKLLDIQEEIFEAEKKAAKIRTDAQLAADEKMRKLKESKESLSTDIISSASANSIERITPVEKRQMQVESFFFDKDSILSNPLNIVIKEKLNNDTLNNILVTGYNKSVDAPMISRLGIDIEELLQDFDDGKFVSPYMFLDKLMLKIIAERDAYYKASQENDHDMKIFLEHAFRQSTSIQTHANDGSIKYRSAIVDVNYLVRSMESETGIIKKRNENANEEPDYRMTNQRYEEFVKYCNSQHTQLLNLRNAYTSSGNVFIDAFSKIKAASNKRQKREFDEKIASFKERYKEAEAKLIDEKYEEMIEELFQAKMKEYKEKLESTSRISSRQATEANVVGKFKKGGSSNKDSGSGFVFSRGERMSGSSYGSSGFERSDGIRRSALAGVYNISENNVNQKTASPERATFADSLRSSTSVEGVFVSKSASRSSGASSLESMYSNAVTVVNSSSSESVAKPGTRFSFGSTNNSAKSGSAGDTGKFVPSYKRAQNAGENERNDNNKNEEKDNETQSIADKKVVKETEQPVNSAAVEGKFAQRKNAFNFNSSSENNNRSANRSGLFSERNTTSSTSSNGNNTFSSSRQYNAPPSSNSNDGISTQQTNKSQFNFRNKDKKLNTPESQPLQKPQTNTQNPPPEKEMTFAEKMRLKKQGENAPSSGPQLTASESKSSNTGGNRFSFGNRK